MINPEPENLITRLNYSERAKGLMYSLAVGVPMFPVIDGMPEIARGIIWGIFFPGFCKAMWGISDKNALALGGFSINVVSDSIRHRNISQLSGEFAGSLIWMGFDGLAKRIYDSGITKPIYRMLNVKDRRLKV